VAKSPAIAIAVARTAACSNRVMATFVVMVPMRRVLAVRAAAPACSAALLGLR
jgi:hypothetical protein